MPIIPKIFVGPESRLNLDDSLHLLGKSEFVDALNITRDQGTAVRNDDAVIGNVKGNRFVPFNLPGGTCKVIGNKPDPVRNCMYYFIWNSGMYHTIARYNNSTRTIDKVFQSITDTGNVQVIDWDVNYKIIHIDIIHRDEGDLLMWVDPIPRMINVATALAGEYAPATALDILVAKAPPPLMPLGEYISDGNVPINNLKGILFEFGIRYIYSDFEKSVFSKLSASPLPANDYQANINPLSSNVINVTFETGNKRIKKIEIAFRQNIGNDWSDYFSMAVLDKEQTGIPDDTTYTFAFTNNGAYSQIDTDESGQIFDLVPKEANAQCLPNGNVLTYGGILEGYDKLADLSVIAFVTYETVPLPDGEIPTGNPTITFEVETGPINPLFVYRINFSIGSNVTPGDQYLLSFEVARVPGTSFDPPCLTPPSGTHSFNYTAMLGDTNETVKDYFIGQINPIFDVNAFDEGGGDFRAQVITSNCYRFINITVQPIPATTTGGGNFFDRIYKFGGKFRLGIVYFDEQGVTNGVETYTTTPGDISDFEIDVDEFNAFDTAYKRPIVNLTVQHLPPSWAKTYSIVRTENLITQSFFMWKCDDVQDDGTYFYIGIDNLQAYEAETPNFSNKWTFQTGDRLKGSYQFNGANDTGWGAIYSPVLDYEIVGVVEYDPGSGDKTYIKVRKYPGTIAPSAYDANLVFEVYRPALRTDGSLQVYYEFGASYECVVIDGVNYHQGQDATTNPTYQFTDGDIYLRIRSGVGDDYLIQDPNFSDFTVSAINSNGRAFAINENAAETYNPTLVRFSQAYQFGTNINGLNRFYEENFDEYDRNYGAIKKLDFYAQYMKVGQELRIGNVPVNLQIIKDINQSSLLGTSDRLLNQINYYQGDFGIGTCPESWARNNFVVYGCDNIRGVVWRLSQDGLTILSILYKVNSWAISELPLRTGNYKIYGVFNAAVNRYEIALEEAPPLNALSVGTSTTFAYSGAYQLAVSLVDICTASYGTLYSGEEFAVGTIMFTDEALTTFVMGYNYIADINGVIYELDPLSGEVGAATGNVCNTGISGIYQLDNVPGDICDNTLETLYTDIAFAPGAFIYYDSSLSTPVTGFDYISVNGVIYNLNDTTGEVGAATGDTCGSLNPPEFNWTFEEIAPATGGMQIDVNGINVVSATGPSDSGNFTAADGDLIEIRVTGGGGDRKTLDVSDDVSGVLYTGSSTSSQLFSFNCHSSRTYTIDGTVDVP